MPPKDREDKSGRRTPAQIATAEAEHAHRKVVKAQQRVAKAKEEVARAEQAEARAVVILNHLLTHPDLPAEARDRLTPKVPEEPAAPPAVE